MLRVVRPIIVFILIGGVFYLGIHSERTGFVREVLDPGLKQFVLPVLNAFRGSGPEAPQLDLLIGQESMDSLAAIRERALKAGVLSEGKDTWFPALLVFGGDSMNAKIRLKGGLIDHLRTNKWSLRVQLAAGDTLMGMTVFSLQHPNTRNFSNEWIFHRAVAYAGLPALHYHFLDVRINTKSRGLYALEQHFDDALLARLAPQGFVGPVMKFDDELRITTLAEMAQRTFDSEAPLQGDWLSAPITTFQAEKVMADSAKAARFNFAFARLTRFRNGDLMTSEVFDADALAKLFALSDLFGAQHCNDWRNLRFVFDARTALLTPVAFDANAGEPITAIRALREQPPIRFDSKQLSSFYGRLFSDRAFYEAYVAHLDTFSADGWLETFLGSVVGDLAVQEALINNEFPNAAHDPAVFMHCRTVIRQTLRPTNIISASVLGQEGPMLRLGVANMHALPVEVVGIGARDTEPVPCGPILLPPRGREEPLIEEVVEVPFVMGSVGRPMLHIKLVGLPHVVLVPVKGTGKR
ncbi:MAG: hypothetical protein ABI599_16225 [Flavobacteriales bacterium]